MADKFRIINAVIDAAGFYAGNRLLDSTLKVPPAHMRHVIIFAIADILIRNGFLQSTYVEGLLPSSTGVNLKVDAYISVVYILISAAYDSLIDHENAKSAIMDNVIRGLVGLGSNVAIDYVIPKEFK